MNVIAMIEKLFWLTEKPSSALESQRITLNFEWERLAKTFRPKLA